ncbi:hypothetical protein GCK32_006361, partial [Trichostrongylus colubriformis]
MQGTKGGACVSAIGAFKNINGQCTLGDRCSGGSTCRAHICQCVDGSSEHRGRCRQTPGERCTYGETCDGGSSCEFGFCRCPDGHVIKAGKCVIGSSEPGKSCQNGQKCIHGGVCRFGMCMCIAQHVTYKGRCVRRQSVLTVSSSATTVSTPIKVGSVKGPGFKCHDKDICSGGATCREGFCMCNDLEVIINEQCVGSHEKANEIVDKLLIAAPGQSCNARTNCTGGSICINRVCACEQGAIDDSGKCSEVKKEYGANAAPAKKNPEQIQPGSACALTIECPYRTECIRGVCRCKKGETIVDNTCRKAIHQVLPGGKCDPRKGYDCVGEAHCFYGVCTCTRHLINNGRECVTVTEMEMVTPGKRCVPGQSCSGGSRCIDGVCRCPDDEVPDVNKKCVKKTQVYPVFSKLPITAAPGYLPELAVTAKTSVPSTTPVLDIMGELEAFEALLKANPKFSFSEPDSKVPQTIFGHICHNKDECPANSFCFQRLCRCMIGYRASNSFCEPISGPCLNTEADHGKACPQLAHPGEDCIHGQICSYNSYCGLFSGVCECPSGMATINERCERTTAAPGRGCVTSRNCYGSSYCDNGLCLCKTGHELVNDFCVPIARTPVGTVNNLNIQAMGPHSALTSTISPKVQFYSPSPIPLDFTKPPFNFPGRPVIKAVYPNFTPQQMPAPGQVPTDARGFASFPMPYARGMNTKSGDVMSEMAQNTMKLKVSMPGDFCGDGSICIGNSLCQKQFCRCPPNTMAENGVCTGRKRMSPHPRHNNDESFSSREDEEDFAEERQFASPLENCQNFEVCTGGSECSNIRGMGLVCQCPTSRIFLEGECVDVPRSANLAGIGESCQNGEICLGGSKCLQNICMCDENRHDILGICVTTARPGDDCSNGQICVDGAVCAASVKTCVCPPGRSSKAGRCVEKEHTMHVPKTVEPGSECDGESVCEDNSFCSGEGVCVCLPKFELYDGKCVPNTMIKHPGDECHPGNICSAGSECRDNICTCPNGWLIIEGKCVRVTNDIRMKPVQRKECDIDANCPAGHHCVDGECVCHGDSSHCSQKIPKTIEVSCREDAQCPEHAVCADGLCVCKDKYSMINNLCAPRDMTKWQIVKGSKTVKDISLTSTERSAPGTFCMDTNYCAMGSVCLENRCVCGFGSIAKDGSCVPAAGNLGIGDRCSDTFKCRDGLVCVLEKCMCPDDNLTCDGICIQPGPRPTLPPSSAYPYPSLQQTYQPSGVQYGNQGQLPQPTSGNHGTMQNVQGRKIAAGANCGPFDTCVGSATCVDGLCVCPSGMHPSPQGRCEPSAITTSPSTSSAYILSPGTPTYARPGQKCANGEICVAGSNCNEKGICACPAEKPVLQGDECVPAPQYRSVATPGESCDQNTVCTEESSCQSGQCRCKYGFIAVSGHCVALPVPTTPAMKNVVLAKPLDSCDNGEQCEGGSSCDEDTGVCMCPPGHIVFGVQCQLPPTSNQAGMTPLSSSIYPTPSHTQSVTSQPSHFQPSANECKDDTNCGENKVCVMGRCKCKPGFVDHDGVCKALEEIEIGERPVPVSFAKHKMETMMSQRIIEQDESTDSTTPQTTLRTPSRQETQRPRIIGPPIRRPRPKPKSTSSGGSGSYKTGSSGSGNCPPGNEATRDDSGRLIMCNGFEPNCPPRSYCYITTGKPLPKLKYGQFCHNDKDMCTLGSVCIDYVCKCGPGHALTTSGWCEPFDFKPSAKTSMSFAQFTKPAIDTAVSTPPSTMFTSATAVPQGHYAPSVGSQQPLARPSPQQAQHSTPSAPKVVRHRFLGTKCRYNDVCINGGECINSICQCPENLFERGGRCLRASQIPHAAPSEPCENGEMCMGGSICDSDSKTCICAADHAIVGGVCRSRDASPFSLPGQSCAAGEECSGNSVCISGNCQCANDHYIEDGYCRHKAEPLIFTLSWRKPPGGLTPNTVPQFVVLTFDDAVNGRTFPDYLELFEKVKYRNPNGCPVAGTFFISHEWTNYDSVQWLYQQGMELASNSISHVSLEGTDANRWLNEMDGQRRIMAKFANANEEEIIGMRAPQLVLGGNEQFEMMARAGFVYDNSMSVNPGARGEPFWPQTMDHTVPWDCYDAQCPTGSFPGLWAIPLNQFYGSYIPQIDSFRRSSMVRAAVDLNTTVDQMTTMLFTNFDRSYLTNRAPFILSLNADLLQLNGRNTGMQALQRFLEEVLYRKDVYVVTIKQLIQWMRNPVPLNQMSQ